MRILGIDLAAQAKKTFACRLEAADGVLTPNLFGGCEDEQLLELADGCEKVAIDCPFGWPNDFVDALVAHRAAEAWPAPDDSSPETFRASLSFRATDRIVMHTRRPLSVSTDKLGVTAMRCAHLLHQWSTREHVDRMGSGRLVEVYPAGALTRWGLEGSGYKGSDHEPLGRLVAGLCSTLPALRLSAEAKQLCASDDDAFDSLVAALVGRAAGLGLTDGPPPELEAQAAQEGWIRLPLRGSLPFLASSPSELVAQPAAALARRLASSGVKLDGNGYVADIDDILLPSLTPEAREQIKADLTGKGGSELEPRSGTPKFHAAHSSAALAANTFGPFLGGDTELAIASQFFGGRANLEVECPSGLRGNPPTLDLVIEGRDEILAVESKFTETFGEHEAEFRPSYAEAFASMHRTWRDEYVRLVQDPLRYRFLNAAQLLKHYLGLRRTYPDQQLTLAYLYWTPTNAPELAPCVIHAAELDEFASKVNDPKVRFVHMAYADLWDEWSSSQQPAWLRQHAAALRSRYELAS